MAAQPDDREPASLDQLRSDVVWLDALSEEIGYRACGVIRLLTWQERATPPVSLGAIGPRIPCVFEDGHGGRHSWAGASSD